MPATTEALHARHDDLLPRAQPRPDPVPSIAQFAKLDGDQVHARIRAHNPYVRLAIYSHHRLLRHQECFGVACEGDTGAHEHAGKESLLRVVHQDTQQQVARTGIHGDPREQYPPGQSIGRTVAAQDGHRQAALGRSLSRHGIVQGIERGGRATHVDIDLVDLLYARHRRAVTGGHQRTFRHQRLIDTTCDGRIHRCKFQVQTTARQGCPRLRNVRVRLLALGHRVLVGLATDQAGLDQRLQAPGVRAGSSQHRLCAPQGRGSRFRFGDKWRGVDLEQRRSISNNGCPARTSAPCSNSRRRTMPLTWGRISAIRTGATRADRSSVNSRDVGTTVITFTTGAGALASCSAEPQPVRMVRMTRARTCEPRRRHPLSVFMTTPRRADAMASANRTPVWTGEVVFTLIIRGDRMEKTLHSRNAPCPPPPSHPAAPRRCSHWSS